MRPSFARVVVAAAAWWLASAAGGPAAAQDYPARTTRIIIPLAAGGGGDVFARALADELQKAMGQPFVVENRPGGGLNIGARACAEAPPDGYTICVLSSEPVIYNQFLFKSLGYDPESLEPIAMLFINSLALVVNSSLKVKTIPELVALSRARPGTLSYGTFSFAHAQFMEKLKQDTGADIVRVPFRGGNELLNAVLAGSSPIALLALSNMIAQLQSGHVTGLGIASTTRSPLFPDVPTFAEVRGQDYPATWFGLFAPGGTPRAILQRLSAEVQRIVERPDFRQRMFFERGVEPGTLRLDGFARFLPGARKAAEQLVKDSGQRPE